MKNELERHATGDRIKWVVAFSMIALLILGMVCTMLRVFMPERPEKPEEQTQTETAETLSTIPLSKRMSFSANKASVQSQSDNSNNSTVRVEAQIEPSTAADKRVDYSINWKDGNSTWARGKNVAEYLTATQLSDGSTIADIVCLQAFGEPIIVTVKSRQNSAIKAECQVDYAARVIPSLVLHDTYLDELEGWDFYLDDIAMGNEVVGLCLEESVGNTTFGSARWSASISTYSAGNVYTKPAESLTGAEIYVRASAEFNSGKIGEWKKVEFVSTERAFVLPELVWALDNSVYQKNAGGGSAIYMLNRSAYESFLAKCAATKHVDFELKITAQYGTQSTEFIYPCHFSHNSPGLAVENISISGDIVV